MSKNKEFGFSAKAKTQICLEEADTNNPYVCTKQYLSGYDTLELAKQKSFVEVLMLLFKLELPSPEAHQLMETLMIGLINPGPRHPATRAAMSVGISKVNSEHILPISLSVMGGNRGGATEVAAAYQFISDNVSDDVSTVSAKLELDSDSRFAPGFGSHYGQVDTYVHSLADMLNTHCQTGKHFKWAIELAKELAPKQAGLLDVGLAAAVFCDLELGKRESAALYQFLRAPGLMAHGLEQTHKPVNDIPLPEDSNYVYNPL